MKGLFGRRGGATLAAATALLMAAAGAAGGGAAPAAPGHGHEHGPGCGHGHQDAIARSVRGDSVLLVWGLTIAGGILAVTQAGGRRHERPVSPPAPAPEDAA